MKKLLLITVLGLVMAGCSLSSAATAPATEEKLADTTLTGKVVVKGNVVALQEGTKSTTLDSYSLKLSEYANQQVQVTGQYSGDTLFVDEIKPQ